MSVRGPLSLASQETENSAEELEHEVFSGSIIIILVLLMVYMLFEAYKQKSGLVFGHEASLVCLAGLAFSAYELWRGDQHFTAEFNDDLFYYFVLPPIVFSSGFNMYRKKFTANLRNILLFGVVGTFVGFACFSVMTIQYCNRVELKQYTYDEADNVWVESTLSLETIEILIMCALLCSSDVIAAISLVKPKEQPKLFSIVFGEGIVNDAVAIILFNAMRKQAKRDEELGGSAALKIGGDFCTLACFSMLIGLAYGLTVSLLLKCCRACTKSVVAECSLIFSIAYLSYVTAEICDQSGIIALLICGVTMAHYAWYSLSPQGKSTSTVVFQFLGFIAEGFVFAYLGLTFFSYRYMPFSPDLIMLEFAVIAIGRFMGTIGIFGLLKCCSYEKDHPTPVTCKELLFIWYAGLIRGAIVFGLICRISSDFVNKDVIVTTCLAIILGSTIVFGSTVGLVTKCCFRRPSEDLNVVTEDVLNSSVSSIDTPRSPMVHPNALLSASKQQSDFDMSNRKKQLNQPLLEPSESGSVRKKPYKMGCVRYLQRFDELILRPLFIHKYHHFKAKDAEDFFNVMIEEGNNLESMYRHQKDRKPPRLDEHETPKKQM